MPKRRPSERSNDQFADGETGVTVHGYLISTKPALDPAAELRLVADIQQGKIAFDEIVTAMTAEIATHLATRDLAPLILDEQRVGRLVRDVVAQQVIKHAKKDGALMVIGNAVANAIQHAIGDLLESADLLPEFPFEEWIEQKLPQNGVVQMLSPVLLERADLWQAVSLRENAIELLTQTHIWIAVPFARSAMRQRFDFGDLMNEAVLILRQAAEGFEPESGNRFSSYAKGALKKELWRRSSPTEIGVTRYTGDQVRDYYRMRRTMMQEQGHSVNGTSISPRDATHQFSTLDRRDLTQAPIYRRVPEDLLRQTHGTDGRSHRSTYRSGTIGRMTAAARRPPRGGASGLLRLSSIIGPAAGGKDNSQRFDPRR